MDVNDQKALSTPPDKGPRRTARRIGLSLGAVLLAAGIAILANVAWELWGTGIGTARAQHRLGQQFNTAVAGATHTTAADAATADVVAGPTTNQLATPLGGLLSHLVIPRIGVSDYVVQGVGEAQLAEGPGHYPGTATIGGAGNVGIAGHRTTYGAPFFNLNELRPGDLIYLTNTSGQSFTYRVTTHFIVAPNDSAVLDPTPVPTLTLTTCNPRFSATNRLVVQATLVR
jgi:sortase A